MFRWVECFLALRFLRPTRSYVSVITVLSLLGVISGVAVLIVVLSVMEGFEAELRRKVIGFNAHISVTNFGIIDRPEELRKRLEREPGVRAVSPLVLGPVMVEFRGKISTPYIRGYEQESGDRVIPLRNHIVAGEWLLGPDAIIVGEEWARKNGAVVGDRILVYSPRNLESLLARDAEGRPIENDRKVFLPAEYEITGIFFTGMYDYDYNFLIVDLAESQRLYNLGSGVHAFALSVDDPDRAALYQSSMNEWLIPPVRAYTWMDQNSRLFSAIAMERRVMSFLLLMILVVAAFGLSSTLITVTVRKSKEIGVMKALGACDHQILAVFTLYGWIVGVAGSAAGTVLGLLIVDQRNTLSGWISRVFGFEVFPAAIYHFPEIPAILNPGTVCLIALSGVVASTLAALVPAYVASQADPAQTLREA
jgi:lipoprotein-releasing system permease protein